MTDSRVRPPRAHSERWFRMESDAEERTAQVYLYDAIDPWWGVTAKDFAAAWTGLDADRIDLYINSPGGDVFDAMAILNVIRRTEAHVTAHVDGIAASAASFIALGADEVVMSRNSELMIHDASGLCWGPAEDMAKMAEDLHRVSDNIASVYADKAGGDVATWRAAMLAETWYSAEEAVTAGLADRVDVERDEAEVKNRIDLSIFNHAGRADAPAPSLRVAARRGSKAASTVEHARMTDPARLPSLAAALADGEPRPPAEPAETDPHQKEGTDLMPDIKKGLLDRLGITDTALDDTAALAALDEALAERAESQPAPFTAPEGTQLIDAEQLEQLRAEAALGAAARQEQVQARRAGIVDAAVREGRIAPARAEHWLAQLTADEEGATAVLDSLAAGTIPLEARGYTGGVDESTDEDSQLYAKLWPSADTTKEA